MGDERAFDCTELTKGMLPPSAMRRPVFEGRLDMILLVYY